MKTPYQINCRIAEAKANASKKANAIVHEATESMYALLVSSYTIRRCDICDVIGYDEDNFEIVKSAVVDKLRAMGFKNVHESINDVSFTTV